MRLKEILLGRVRAIVLVAAALTAMAGDAVAQSWECQAIRMQIDNAPAGGGGGNSAQAARYAKAIRAQEVQIGKAKSQLRALGCSGSIILRGASGGASSCKRVDAALRSMNANMSKLRAQHARLSGGGGGGSKRAALLARYKRFGCDGSDTVRVAREKPSDNGIAAILGDTKKKKNGKASGEARNIEKPRIPGLDFVGDTYRTLCVRKCDGYYFPISFSTTRENLKRDTVACESMCPGTEVEVFMHKVPEEESEDMVSVKGEPYKGMTYAFAYRKDGLSRDPSCACKPISGLVAEGGTAPKAMSTPADAIAASVPGDSVPLPTARPDPLDDYETAADRAGRFTDADILALFASENVLASAEDEIRVVGPVFLPDPSGAIELKAPVRPLVR
jgi:Protein of unknown function (DUF2865)